MADVAGELRAARAAYGLTQAQVGAMLGVSADMVSKIERGLTPGRRWAPAVAQLARRGTITNPPARRVQRVRAPGGVTRMAPPAPPPLRRGGNRWRFGVQRGATAHGRQSTTVDSPKRGLGRQAAREALGRDLRQHRGAGVRGERVQFQVTTRDGRVILVGRHGGYNPATVLDEMDDDLFDWLDATLDGMGYTVGAGNIASVTMIYGRQFG